MSFEIWPLRAALSEITEALEQWRFVEVTVLKRMYDERLVCLLTTSEYRIIQNRQIENRPNC